jgi:Icc-related predicted phosphoesterase
MIYLSGDIHGSLEVDKLERYFNSHKHKKDDTLIILGDAGFHWYGDERDLTLQKRVQALDIRVLWLDGNHENFNIINRLSEVNGEEFGLGSQTKVQVTNDNIIHLMRGYVYTIEKKKFFTFGGANSIDKEYRIPGVSWFPEEMPDNEEYERGFKSLEYVNYRVDYVITHTCPYNVATKLVTRLYSGEEEIQSYFNLISRDLIFKKWYFGHWHRDMTLGKYVGLYNCILKVGDEV